MITIENITMSYQKGTEIIKSLSLALQTGTIHGIVSLNGSGKTTLLNGIFGLKRIDSGKILFNNHPLTKKDMSYLVTENYFYPNITGHEYLNLFHNNDFETDNWNKLFSLPLDKIIDTYSTGMKKKLAFLSILKQNKPVMILDEPFNGLDIETCRILRSILLRLKEKGKTIIITSHIIETLTNLCDFIHYLEDGKIKQSENKEGFAVFEKELYQLLENKNEELILDLTDS